MYIPSPRVATSLFLIYSFKVCRQTQMLINDASKIKIFSNRVKSTSVVNNCELITITMSIRWAVPSNITPVLFPSLNSIIVRSLRRITWKCLLDHCFTLIKFCWSYLHNATIFFQERCFLSYQMLLISQGTSNQQNAYFQNSYELNHKPRQYLILLNNVFWNQIDSY